MINRVCICLLFLTMTQLASAQVSGTVYSEYNNNGSRQTTSAFTEPGAQGVIVTGYGQNSTLYGP
jgi:hypothetical protein